MRIRQTIHRPAFTLMELLVATALILFIMAIIAQMFGSGTKTFSSLRTAAQLSNNARAGINIIRMDLGREKFGTPSNPGGGPYVINQRLDHTGWQPPPQGYFELTNGEPPIGSVIFEPLAGAAADGESIYSTRATSHTLRFTVKIPDAQSAPADLFCAQYHPRFAREPSVNPYYAFSPTFYSQWAEICYFMVATGSSTPTGLPIYNLRRRVRLLPKQGAEFTLTVAEAAQVTADIANGTYPDVIQPVNLGPAVSPPPPAPPIPPGLLRYRVPGPEDLNDPSLNNGLVSRIPFVAHPTGADILLTDVLSFEVKATWYYNPVFNSITNGSSPPPYRLSDGATFTDEPFSVLKPSVFMPYSTSVPPLRIFDTGRVNNTVDWANPTNTGNGFLNPLPSSPPKPPTRINVRALQIKIRVWDPRAEQARQVTIVHEV